MEKYSRRASVLLGLSSQIPFPASPKSVDRNSDIDFNDVFGGPPRRRSSIGERRYSFNERADSFASKQGDEPVVGRNPWTGLSEKPVFGEEPAYGRQHPGNGFFDDVFKGEDYCASSPKMHDREPFSPIFSRISSPIMPLPPMAETLGSPSPPARSSLPARVLRGIDFSSFSLAARSSNKFNDSATEGGNPSYSPSLSRFSSLSSQAQEDIRHDIQSFYRTSLSSQELNPSRDRDDRSEGTNTGDSSEKSMNGPEDSTNGSQLQFHFSIYKWANKEVPSTMPPTRMNSSRSKESPKTKKSSSSNGTKTAEKNGRESPTSTLRSNFDHPSNNRIFTSPQSFKLGHGKEERDFGLEQKDQPTKEPSKIIEEPCLFNQEHSSTSEISKQKKKGTSGTGIEVGDSTRIDENLKNIVSNVMIDVDELIKQPSTELPADKTNIDRINTIFSEQNSLPISGESIPEDSNFTVIDVDLAFQEDFLIKELPQDELKQSQMQNDREERKEIDAKIRQWSRGKEGNIRSLLSTLQYVLWPESGWRPVPLVDIIDGNAVKRSYQRALLCLHPDKLQQRGVTSRQKYTAEKVFDILQDAWSLFSSVGLL